MKRLILTLILTFTLALTASAQTGGTTLDNVNLRASASFGDNVLTQIPINSPVYIYGRNDNGAWLQVGYNGATGWVSPRYVQWNGVQLLDFPVIGGTFDAPPSVAVSSSAFTVSTTTRLNIRREPRIGDSILTTLPAGQSGVAVGRSRDGAWVAVDMGSVQGWVSGAYLASSADLMGLPITSDFFNAPVEVMPEADPIASIITSTRRGQYTFTGPAVGNTSTYDVEITLQWDSTANLDLRVIGPDGYEIAPYNRQSPTGGYFQQPVGANENCPRATASASEVVTWRLGTAPSGLYTIRVIHTNSCNAAAEDKTVFSLRVNNDGPQAFFNANYINPGDQFTFSFIRP